MTNYRNYQIVDTSSYSAFRGRCVQCFCKLYKCLKWSLVMHVSNASA